MEETNPSTGTATVGNWTNTLSGIASATSQVITALKTPKTTAPAGTAQKSTAATGLTTKAMALIGVGIVAVIVLVVLLTRGGKKA